MSSKSTLIKLTLVTTIIATAFIILFSASFAMHAEAASRSKLDSNTLGIYGMNNILFYDPNGGCVSGEFSSSVCGSTPEEKYWSALRQTLDEEHAAAVMGSIQHEGGFGPTRWEIGVNVTGDGGKFKRSWNELFTNCTRTGRCGGVGAFGITWTLSPYLQYINQNASELIYYFKTPEEYSWNGSTAIGKIGDAAFSKIVELEVAYVLKEANLESFKKTTSLEDAADWWTKNYENCRDCCGGADSNHSCEQIQPRRASARKAYEQFKDYTCPGSTSTSSVSSNSTSTLHAPSGDGWLSESDISGYAKSAHRYEDGQTIGLSCPRFDDNIAVGSSPVEFATPSKLPQMIILHYMGAQMAVDGYDYCKAEIGNISTPPHFSIYPKEKKVVQHIPLTQPSGSVEEGEGKWDRWAIQIEISGGQSDMQSYGQEEWSYVADLMAAIAKQTGIPLTSNVDWNSQQKLSTESMKQYIGVLGHQHVQGNDHGDPGPIWDKLKAEIDKKDYSVGCSGGDSSSGTNYCAEGETCTSDGFTTYSQSDSRWNGSNAGKWTTMSDDGCGPNAFATAATNLLHQKITPKEVSDYMCSSGLTCRAATGWGDAVKLAEHYGIESKQLTASNATDWQKTISEYLGSGWIIHAVGAGGEPWAFGRTTNGHYIVIRGITPDGKWKIANNTWAQNDQDWDPQLVVNGIIKNGGGGITALRSTNSGACVSTCQEQSSGTTTTGQLVTGGFKTAEEADKAIMESYRSLKNTSRLELLSKYGIPLVTCHEGVVGEFMGYSIFNCVSFSYYFLNKYTDLSLDGGRVTGLGNGNQIVGELSKRLNLPTGDEPKPYAIFSWDHGTYGHTGVVLGVPDENTMIIGEASCSGGRNHIGAFKYERKNGVWYGVSNPNGMTNWGPQPTFKFAYTDGHLKGL